MASTYTQNTGIEKIGAGEQTGLWNATTNLNFDIIDRASNGVGSIALSGTTHTLTTTDGSLSDGQYKVLVFGGSPSGTNTVTVAPNSQNKQYLVVNNSGQSVIISQGSGASVTVANGATDIIYCDGAGSGAAVIGLAAALSGLAKTANNGSDFANVGAVRTNLGLAIGTNVQAYAAVLANTTASFLTAEKSKLTGIEALADVTDTPNVTAAGALMDSEVNANLKTFSLPASTTISAFGKTLVDDADAPAALVTLGVTATAAELNILDGVTATTEELNILDGVTSTAAELNLLDGVTATTAELNILDGVTATAAELNALDGITATVTELNYTDGVTSPIQAQIDGIPAVIDEDDMASDSATRPPSQQSVKAYVDAAAADWEFVETIATTSGTTAEFPSAGALADGYTYALELLEVEHNSGSNQNLRVDVYGANAAAYIGDPQRISQNADSTGWYGFMPLPTTMRVAMNVHTLPATNIVDSSATGTDFARTDGHAYVPYYHFATAQKIDKVRISVSGGTFDKGAIKLWRKAL